MILKFSPQEKLKAIERELALRRNVYPKQVKWKKMSKTDADHQIKIFDAIRDDYVAWVLVNRARKSTDETNLWPPSSNESPSEATSGKPSTSASPPPATSTKSSPR